MNLDEIQEMWQRDSVIDPDNLHDESLKIPQLHSKYYTLYNTITLLREKARDTYNKVRLERYNYYTGKAPAEVYVEEPFPYKVREKDAIQRHMDADERLNKIDMKIRYYDTMLKFLEEIIRMISNRTYQIKNSIEFLKFTAGYN
ncbi:MAG: recombination mediator protein UvsY [Minisyncoccia bacterium]